MYDLPESVKAVAEARNKLRAQYRHHVLKNEKYLEFTPDGKFVGDLGEAIAAELFDLELDPQKHIDGYTRCDKRIPVQVKATGRTKGTFQFRKSDYPDHDKVHLIAIRMTGTLASMRWFTMGQNQKCDRVGLNSKNERRM